MKLLSAAASSVLSVPSGDVRRHASPLSRRELLGAYRSRNQHLCSITICFSPVKVAGQSAEGVWISSTPLARFGGLLAWRVILSIVVLTIATQLFRLSRTVSALSHHEQQQQQQQQQQNKWPSDGARAEWRIAKSAMRRTSGAEDRLRSTIWSGAKNNSELHHETSYDLPFNLAPQWRRLTASPISARFPSARHAKANYNYYYRHDGSVATAATPQQTSNLDTTITTTTTDDDDGSGGGDRDRDETSTVPALANSPLSPISETLYPGKSSSESGRILVDVSPLNGDPSSNQMLNLTSSLLEELSRFQDMKLLAGKAGWLSSAIDIICRRKRELLLEERDGRSIRSRRHAIRHRRRHLTRLSESSATKADKTVKIGHSSGSSSCCSRQRCLNGTIEKTSANVSQNLGQLDWLETWRRGKLLPQSGSGEHELTLRHLGVVFRELANGSLLTSQQDQTESSRTSEQYDFKAHIKSAVLSNPICQSVSSASGEWDHLETVESKQMANIRSTQKQKRSAELYADREASRSILQTYGDFEHLNPNVPPAPAGHIINQRAHSKTFAILGAFKEPTRLKNGENLIRHEITISESGNRNEDNLEPLDAKSMAGDRDSTRLGSQFLKSSPTTIVTSTSATTSATGDERDGNNNFNGFDSFVINGDEDETIDNRQVTSDKEQYTNSDQLLDNNNNTNSNDDDDTSSTLDSSNSNANSIDYSSGSGLNNKTVFNDTAEMDTNQTCVYSRTLAARTPGNTYRVMSLSIYVLMGIFSMITNTIIFCALVRKRLSTSKDSFTATDIFLMNLTLGDMFFSICSLPVVPLYSLVYKQWVFGVLLCQITGFTQCLSVFVSTYTFVAIGHHRYNLIVKPLAQPISKRRALFYCILIWATPAAFSGFYATNMNLITDGCSFSYCSESWGPDAPQDMSFILSVFTFMTQLVMPLIWVCWYHWQVSRKLADRGKEHQSSNRLSSPPATSVSGQFGLNSLESTQRLRQNGDPNNKNTLADNNVTSRQSICPSESGNRVCSIKRNFKTIFGKTSQTNDATADNQAPIESVSAQQAGRQVVLTTTRTTTKPGRRGAKPKEQTTTTCTTELMFATELEESTNLTGNSIATNQQHCDVSNDNSLLLVSAEIQMGNSTQSTERGLMFDHSQGREPLNRTLSNHERRSKRAFVTNPSVDNNHLNRLDDSINHDSSLRAQCSLNSLAAPQKDTQNYNQIHRSSSAILVNQCNTTDLKQSSSGQITNERAPIDSNGVNIMAIREKRRKEKEKKVRQLNKKLLLLVASFAIAWTPLNVFNMIQDRLEIVNDWEYLQHVGIVSHLIACSSVCLNPILYFWMSDNYRQELRNTLPKWLLKSKFFANSLGASSVA